MRLGLGMAGIAWTAIPFALVWLVIGLFLGRRYKQLRVDSGQAGGDSG